MVTKINYTAFNDLDFAGDTSFQEWVFRPSTESEIFWKNFIEHHPSQREAIEKASLLLKSIQFKKEFPSNAQIERSLKKALLNINAHPSDKKDRTVGHIVTMNRWWAAAAILLFLASVGYFLINKKEQTASRPLAAKEVKHDILPGGNRATLTLANGSTIILDSAQNGLLSKQGNTQIVKLANGKLAYQNENSNPATIQYNTITTPRGGQYQLTLSDGSQVWLNAASSITFPTSFVGDKREVKITGEAYFEVAHNAAMPFRVLLPPSGEYKGAGAVEVLGTHFNINAYEDEGVIKTTLLEGSVKVSEGNASVHIKPGTQAVIGQNSDKITINNNVDLDEVVAWKNGLFYFNQADIKVVMRQISRWYNVDVLYEGKIPEREFQGEMQRDLNLSQVLKLLNQNKINFKIEGNQLIIKP